MTMMRHFAAAHRWKENAPWHHQTLPNDDETRHQPDDAIAMLTADHRQVRALFQQYADTPDTYLRQIITEHVFAELTLHTAGRNGVLPGRCRAGRRGGQAAGQ